MEMKETHIINFSSEDPFIRYFKHASLSDWRFDSYKKYLIETNRVTPRLSSMYAKYRLCLRNLSQLKDLSVEKQLVVANLIKEFDLPTQEHEEQQSSTNTNYYNYGSIGSIGIQGNVSVIPKKRRQEESSSLEEAEAEKEVRELSPSTAESPLPEEPTSDLTYSTDETYNVPGTSSTYGEILIRQKYVLTLNGFVNNHFNDKTVHYMDNDLSLDERLRLSSINYYHVCPADLLLYPVVFADEIYSEIRKWRRSLLVKQEFFSSQITIPDHPTEDTLFRRDLGTFLLNLKETLDRPLLTNSYKQSEIDFSFQNIAILFRFIFNSRSNVNLCWERPFATNKGNTEKMVRTDFLLYTNNQELGCGEVKLNCANERLEEEDRARLGESLKQQLHYRIKQAKSTREFRVFGVFVVDNTIELYCSSFSKENGYSFILLNVITLPTLMTTYASLEESLEILFSFKKLIEKSLQHPSDCEKPYIHSEYHDYLTPTVSFIKSSQ